MATVPTWRPPVALTPSEERLLRRCKKQPIFAFLRAIRHQLFDEAFQRELARMYPPSVKGRPPVAPALLAMATILQAARRVSDEDAAFAVATERAWQMVLGTLDTSDEDDAPFGQTALFDFRMRLIAHEMDRRLVERTLELATRSGLFSPRALRAAFDASPLRGGGRVEDTINLLGHAARELVTTLAARFGKPFDVMAREAGIALLEGSSMKAALDVDWTDLQASHEALQRLLRQVEALSTFIATHLAEESAQPPLKQQLETLQQVLTQDLEPDPSGQGSRIKQGVAKERRISITDPQMRHGRKSKAVRFDGYKRHVATLHQGGVTLMGAVALTAANRPEGEAAAELFADVERQGLQIHTLDIDRAYLLTPAVQWRRGLGLHVNGRAPQVVNGERYDKTQFVVDFARGVMTCPAGQQKRARAGLVVRFDARVCNGCPQKGRCTESQQGRSVAVHPQEEQLLELRRKAKTPEGRAELRKRVVVEHSLARVGQLQGPKARYRGVRKNLFDLRRAAVVANLFALRAAGFEEAA